MTHVGMKRAHNEDSLRLFREENLFIVADGMGGHASGEVASQMSVETLAEFFRATSEDDEITWPYKLDKGRKYEENRVITGIKLSNRRIHEAAARDAKLKGMGTTIVVTFFVGDTCYIGHVGDSRVYRFRAGQLIQLTEDHSLLNDYIKMRQLTPEEIEAFPHKNVIVRALGMKDTVQVDVMHEAPQPGRRLPALLRRPLGHGQRRAHPEILTARRRPRRRTVRSSSRRPTRRRHRQHHRRADPAASPT
jgi:serine/threonine protein phosphatase PrpC